MTRNEIRVAVGFEVAAVADRYEQDVAPCDENERTVGILDAAERIPFAPTDDLRYALLELAGRTLAWLEHDAAEQTR